MGQDDSINDRPQKELTADTIRLPNFRMIRELGRGGMGVVFLASQVSLEREVAVKVFPATGVKDTNLKRFFREVQLCVTLSHPNVVKLLDAGSTDEWAWLAMECIKGQPLDRWVHANGPMKANQLAAAMEELADALDFVHQNKIVHRDLKPANVMKPDTGGLKLMDFGLGRMESSVTLTDQGAVVGSPRYLAPETVTQGVMDTVTDLYGLGFLFYEISTATRPYDGRSLRETLAGIVKEVLPPPSRLEPSLPAELDRIIMKLLEKNRDQRYQSCQELLADVRKLRASEAFVGTSWETSRPNLDLLGSAADLLKPAVPEPTKPIARPSRKTAVPRVTGSFAVTAPPPAGPSTAKVLGIAAVVGALIGFATIALVRGRRPPPPPPAERSPSAAPVVKPSAPSGKPLAVLVDALAAPLAELEAPQLVEKIEKSEGKRPTAKPALLPDWNRKAADWLLLQPFAENWRKLTSKHDITRVLEDTSHPLEVRRRLYTAALFYLHLDDFVATPGQDPPFGAEALIKPWAQDVDEPGHNKADLKALCLRAPACAEVISNNDELHWYAFYDERGRNDHDPVNLIAGPSKRKYEDEPLPQVDIAGPKRPVSLLALTRFLFLQRYFQLDLRPISPEDGDIQVRTVLIRGRPGVKGNARSLITGTRVSGDLVPPGKYQVRIRAFRMVGEENWGMWLEELRAAVGAP